MQSLDVLVAAAVEQPPLATPLATPPASPVIDNCYIVAASPTGAWAGKAHNLAAHTSGGWRFVPPREGMTAFVKSSGLTAAYRGGAWVIGELSGSQVTVGGLKVVGARSLAIPAPTGGSTADLEARAAIGQLLVAMREHGLI